jgi:hypothetical protein
MALGGFLGSDPASTPARFAQQVALGQVRFVLVGGGGPGGGRFPGGGGTPNGGAFPGNGGGSPFPGNGRFPNGGGGFPGNGRFPRGGGPAGGFGRGTAASIVALAQEYCSPVTSATAGAGFPASYDGQVLDCEGVADQLLVASAT